MNIAVLDADTLGKDLDLSPLNAVGNVRIFPSTTQEQIPEHLGDCPVAVVNKLRMNASVLQGNSTLRLICIFATGYDNIDVAYCRKHGIAVCNVVGYSTRNVAQLTVSVALSLVTHLPEYARHVADGSYSAGTVANCLSPAYHEIAGMTWGIAGYGNIGRAVGAVAEALGCRVIACKRSPAPGVELVDWDTLCRESDILSIHLPLNGTTRGLFNADRIAQMKKTAILINMARGAVTDEAAIADAIEQGRLAGFGSDVFSVEPFGKDHPFSRLLGRDNVCLTPHMAWGSVEARERCLTEIVENIRSFAAGGTRCRVDL